MEAEIREQISLTQANNLRDISTEKKKSCRLHFKKMIIEAVSCGEWQL